MISLFNLCDFLIKLILKKLPIGQTELVISDDTNFSTSELIEIIYRMMKKRNMLFYIPKNLLYMIFTIIGFRSEILKLSSLILKMIYFI